MNTYQSNSTHRVSIWMLFVIVLSIGAMNAVALGPKTTGDAARTKSSAQRPASLNSVLEPIRAKYHLPALGGAIIDGDTLTAIGAVGVREAGHPEKVTTDDLWHIGSCTKAMTATLIGMLVEQGKMSWDMILADVFPDLRESMHPDYRSVTVAQLLTHRAGMPRDLDADGLWKKLRRQKGTPREQRRQMLEAVLKGPPIHKPGTKFQYSNAGVAIAGVMAETVTDEPYEELIRTMLFKPLGMTSVGFGAPGTADRIDQPRGHHRVNGTDEPVEPGKFADNPPAIAPAGTLHCTLADWAKFVSLHMAGERGKDGLLKSKTIQRMHTAPEKPDNDYAMGWGITKRPWGGGTVLTHNGSNTSWYATVWIAPQRNFAVLITTNLGPPEAAKACDELAGALIAEHEKLHPSK